MWPLTSFFSSNFSFFSKPAKPSSWANYINASKDDSLPLSALKDALKYQDKENGNALDIGCGSGKDTLAILKKKPTWKVTSIDIAPEAAVEVSRRVKILAENEAKYLGIERRIELITGDFLEIDFQGKKFDLINSSAVLPYVGEGNRERFNEAWNKTLSLLAPGGSLTVQMYGSEHSWKNSPNKSKHPLVFLNRTELEELFPKEIFQKVFIEEKRAYLPQYGILNSHEYIVHAIRRSF